MKSYKYFTVRGATLNEIFADLEKRGPRVESQGGTRHPGATRMEFTSSLEYEQRGRSCKISNAKVTMKALMTIPRWQGSSNASGRTALVWDVMANDIKRHEAVHADIAARYAKQLESALAQTSSLRGCEAVQADAERITARVLKRHDDAQAAFDRTEGRNFEKRMQHLLSRRSAPVN